jgi:putative tricarboxylic transport membrane protein
MRLSHAQLGGLFMFLFSVCYGALILEIPVIANEETFTARSMPIFLTILGTTMALLLLFSRDGRVSNPIANLNWKLGLAFLLLMSAYGLALRPIGFVLTTVIFLCTSFWFLGERQVFKNLAIAIPLVLLFWLLMSELLGVYLPPWPDFLHV